MNSPAECADLAHFMPTRSKRSLSVLPNWTPRGEKDRMWCYRVTDGLGRRFSGYWGRGLVMNSVDERGEPAVSKLGDFHCDKLLILGEVFQTWLNTQSPRRSSSPFDCGILGQVLFPAVGLHR